MIVSLLNLEECTETILFKMTRKYVLIEIEVIYTMLKYNIMLWFGRPLTHEPSTYPPFISVTPHAIAPFLPAYILIKTSNIILLTLNPLALTP